MDIEPTNQEEKAKLELKNRFTQILSMIQNGCGRERCSNPSCFSNPYGKNKWKNLSKNEIAGQALLLLKKNVEICKFNDIPKSLQMEEFEKLLNETKTNNNFSILNNRVQEVFLNLDSLNLCFMTNNDVSLFPTEDESYLNPKTIKQFYSDYLHSENIKGFATLQKSLTDLISLFKDPNICRAKLNEPKDLRFLLIILFMPGLLDYENINSKNDLISFFLNLSEDAKKIFIRWLSNLSIEDFTNFIEQMQNSVTIYLMMEKSKFDESLQNFLMSGLLEQAITSPRPEYSKLFPFLKLFELFYKANKIKKKVTHEKFQIVSIAEEVNHEEQYKFWKKSNGKIFNFLEFPWILDVKFKANILEDESRDEMKNELKKDLMNLRNMNNLLFINPDIASFNINVRRDNLIKDTLDILNQQTTSLKKKLRVKFAGEPGIDEGGVRKEYFQLLTKQLFCPDYFMFVEKMNKTLFWFNGDSFECGVNFELLGMLLGLAIYNSINLDLRFPPLVYKKLLDEEIILDDLKYFDLELYEGIIKFLTFDGDVFEVYCRTFQIEYENLGCMMKYDLKENGENIPVTNENKEEYIKLYLDWLVNKSIESQFKNFKKGFYKVVTGDAIKLFSGEELNELICGCPKLDFADFQKETNYENGYEANTPIIKYLWEVLNEYDDEKKKKFLFFCTGSDRVPISGFSSLNFIVVKHGDDSDSLPTSHTCFNHFLLPEYSSKEKLKEKLDIALNNAEGFGLF